MTQAASSLADRALGALPRTRVPRSVEFLAVGGVTLLLFPALWLLRRMIGLDSAELAVGFLMFHGAHLINDPHFAVTYLLFYKDAKRRAFGNAFTAAQRARYWVAGLIVPLALAIWLIRSLSSPTARTMGWLIQLMFLLVGWHYVKQGFGVMTVLSARRGVRFNLLERRALLAHCFAGWAYAWASPATAGAEAEEKGVIYWSIAHPRWLEQLTLLTFVASALLLAFTLFLKWQRERRLPPLAPLTGLLMSVWVWSIYSSADPLLVYVIPALHSLQYLYFVWLLTHNRSKGSAGEAYFGPSPRQRLVALGLSAIALGWLLFHGMPDLIDGARLASHRHTHERLGALGATPYFAGFFAFINIHHYFMDNVIWRRENPDMRYLQD
ncbi:MAG TPA: hypothetical protein VGL19_05685 [Polyangiaceae bacterium]